MALRSGDGSLPADNDRQCCGECGPDTFCLGCPAVKRWTFTPCECTPGHPGGYFDASPETCSCRCHWRCPTCDMPDLDHPYWLQARPEDLARHRAESCHEKSDPGV